MSKNTKQFFRYINKWKQKKNTGPLLNKVGQLVSNNNVNQRFSTLSSVVCLSTWWIPDFRYTSPSQYTDPLSVKEELLSRLLQESDSYKLKDPDIIHSSTSRKLADIIVRPLSIIFVEFWRPCDVPED